MQLAHIEVSIYQVLSKESFKKIRTNPESYELKSGVFD